MELIPTFTDISEWEILIYKSTGGSRTKNVSVNPDNRNQYFFKGSKETKSGEVRYPFEFWSEIVSSKVGQSLGFNLLDYNIAYNKNKSQILGSFSKSMVNDEENKLTEGVTYLTGYNSKYNPNLQEHKTLYTFQFICEALRRFELEPFVNNIIDVIIFDSIVGNSDRHQENWGVITNFNFNEVQVPKVRKSEKTIFNRAIERLIQKFKTTDKIDPIELHFQSGLLKNEFAPIYDSGCCLGREFDDEKIKQLLKNTEMLRKYIEKGESEIHWHDDSKKKSHFELIKLIKEKYPLIVSNKIQSVATYYNEEKIRDLIQNIDLNLPDDLDEFKLSEHRKELMLKLITLRVETLLDLI